MHIGLIGWFLVAFLPSSAGDAVWSVAGREIFTLRAAAGGYSPEQRVDALEGRVVEILSKYDGTITSRDIVIRKHTGTLAIYVYEMLLITLTEADARANHTTRDRLGSIWLGRIRTTLPQAAPRVNRRGA